MCSRLYYSRNKYDLKLVPKKFISLHVCGLAVLSNPRAIEFVPKKFRDQDLCLSALRKDTFLFKYIPPKIITMEFCLSFLNLYYKPKMQFPANFFYHPSMQAAAKVYFNDEKIFEKSEIAMKKKASAKSEARNVLTPEEEAKLIKVLPPETTYPSRVNDDEIFTDI